MAKKALFSTLTITFAFACTVLAQNNSIQLRMNYIGNHYGQLFDDWGNGFLLGKPDEKVLNSNLFRYENVTQQSCNGRTSTNSVYYRYYYGGLSFKRDSVFGNWFVRFRIDRFALNIKTKQDGMCLTNGYPYYVGYSNSTRSSMQYTASVGKSLDWKIVYLNIGAEVPLYFRRDAEYYGVSESIDSFGVYISNATYAFVPGGFFTGVSLLAAVGVELGRRVGIMIEHSGGVIYVKQDGKSETAFTFHSPSVGISYRF